MATIADTLNDIQKLQGAMSSKQMELEECSDLSFIRDLMNFITVLLASTTLDVLRTQVEPLQHPYADRY